MRRREAMAAIVDLVGDDFVICSLGPNSDEWHELRPRNNFYENTSMGVTTAIGLGFALAVPQERVWTFEGDGGMLMNLGLLGVLAKKRPDNLKVIIFDNANYECGGALPTLTLDTIDLAAVARACGWEFTETADDQATFRQAVERMIEFPGLALVVARHELGVDASPLAIDGVEAKFRFVRDVERKLGIEIIHPPEHYANLAGWH